MRKRLFTLILAFSASWCASMYAQTIVLSESFENGLPAGWIQESVIGSTSWTTEAETGGLELSYPKGAASGVGRAVLRNETGETQGYKTRLITPVMNLDTVFQPILRYYHAQMKWTADFDTLRVLYRTTKDGEWGLLKEYTSPIQNWVKEELDLPQPSAEYQLCFEGTDNLGRGIVLDSIMVRSKPECTVPHDTAIVNMLEGGATFLWQASYDASDYQVVLIKSNDVLDIDTLSEATRKALVVVDTIVTSFDWQYRFTNLEPNTKYVAYVRSLCDVEMSAWCVCPFLMKAVKNVPYYEDFNLEKISGYVNRISGWTYGNNIDKYTPFINTNQNEADSKYYVIDGSALCFTGDANVNYDIPAGQLVYAATPEINVESLQGLQVRFWGSLGTAGSMNTNARSIIVGVAEDPEDVTTFVPVDTMTLWKYATYEEHITSFANYTGEGKSIVFASYFDKPNQFYIDNVTVEVAPKVAKVSGVNIIPAVTEATISWKAVASSYSVLVSDAYTTQVDTLKAEQKVVVASATNNTYKATGLTEGTDYYVYVKAEGSNEWSNAVEFTTSCQRNLPMFFGFETDEGTYKELNWRNNTSYTYPSCVNIYSTDKLLPNISTTKRTGKGSLYFQLSEGRDAWAVFPMVDTIIQDVEIEFYMKPSSTSYKNTALEVGVMTNPADLSTFVPVAEAKNASSAWMRFYANFFEYQGEGKYIALRWVINEEGGGTTYTTSYPYIDDVTIQPLSYCVTPNLKVESVTTETATLSWVAPGMDHFQVLVGSAPAYAEEKLDTLTERAAGIYHILDIKDTTAVTLPVGKLQWGRTYYAYVRSVCSDSLSSYWSASATVTLAVPEALETPYTETFEGYTSGAGNMAAGWVKADPKCQYPYVYSSSKKNGSLGLYMVNTSSYKPTELYAPVVDIDDLSKLLVSFYAKAGSAASATYVDSLYVGVGNDPKDPNEVITWLDTISIPTTAFNFYRLRFPNWEPYMGKRVVFSTKNAKTNTLHLDDITFESFVNATPYDVELLSANDVEASFQWTAEATKGWNVLVTTESVDPTNTAALDPSKVFFQGVTNNNPYTLTGLTAQTNYYVYLKPVEGNADWSEELHILTQCLRLKPGRYYKMGFEGIVPLTTSNITSYAKSGFPECWVRHGADEDATSVSNTPFIYQMASTYKVIASSNVREGGLASAQLKTTTALYPAWFTTPELDVRNMADVNVKFWAKAGSATYQMEFGVMVDPDDFTTYTKLADIIPGHTSWAQYSFLLEDMGYKPEMGKYVAFAMSQPKGWTFYIDDIEISASTCRAAKPILSKLTHNSVRVAYSTEPTNMRVLLAKDYEFNAEELNLSDSILVDSLKTQGVIVMDSVVSGQMGIQFADLLSDTDYSAALLTICEDDMASWATTSWTTMCPPNTLEEVALIDFEKGYNDTTATSLSSAWRPVPCWVTGSKAIAAVQTYIPYVLNKDVAPAGQKSLSFYTNTTNNGAYAIMPALDVDSITKYEMTFQGRAGTSQSKPSSISAISSTYAGSLIVGVVTDPSDFSTFVAVDTVVMEDNDVHRCKVRFSAYTGDANGEFGKFVAFLSEFPKTNYFFVDNIAITPIEECGEPLDVSVDSISDTEAIISWNGTTDAYRVVVATEKLKEEQWEEYAKYVKDDTVSTPMIALKNLTPNTQYFVYVKALCGAGKWNLQGVNFATNCPPMLQLPYEENFDRYSSASTKNPPSCWVTFNKGLTNPDATYPSVYNSAKYGSAGNGLYWTVAAADSTLAKRPTLVSLPVEDVSRTLISFKLKCTASTTNATNLPSSLAIGYATDISCADSLAATVQFVDTISPEVASTAWGEYVVNMKDAEKKTAYLVFQQIYNSSKGTSLYMDDLKIELTPSCFEPMGAEVLATTYDAATIQIDPFFETDKAWDVMMVSKDGKDTILTTVDTTTAIIKGLKYSTYYTMYVRTNCGEGDVSAWADDAVEFYTDWKIGDGTVYTFEHSEGVVLTPLSGSTTTAYAHPSFYIGGNLITTNASYTPYQTTSTGVARSGKASMQFYNTGSFYQSWIALPMVMGEDSLQIRFDMRAATADSEGVITNIKNYDVSRFQIGVIDEDYNLDSYKVIAEFKPSYITWNGKATEENNYLFDQIVVPMPTNLAGKRLVMMNPSRMNSSYVYVDNLCIEKKQGWQTPAITTSTIAPTTLTVDWVAPGSNKWNVYLTQNVANFPLANVPVEDIVAKQEGLTAATATFTGLQPNTEYIVYVQVAGQTDIAATSARRLFKTPADVKIATDSVITFEGVYTKSMSKDLYGLYPLSTTVEDTLLAMSNNWYVGNMGTVTLSNTPWARLNGYLATGTTTNSSYAKVRVAYAGERALQLLPGTTNDQLGAYAVMPEVDGDYDTLQVNFYARPFYEDTTGMVGVNNSIYKTKPLIIGTMSDPNNPATFELIDSLYYNDVTLTTSTPVASVENKGFELFSFRLAGVKGKYITFSAPVGAGHWYIDNIFFSAKTCIRPLEFEASDITKNSVVLTWRAMDGNNCIVQLSTSQDFKDICYVDTVPANQALKVKDLKSVTTYYARVCEMCDANNTSAWTNTSFTTECFEVGPNYTCGFEVEDGRAHQGTSTSTSYDIAQCWTSGTTYETSSTYLYVPVVQNSSGTMFYARNTLESVEESANGRIMKSTGSLKMYATANSNAGEHNVNNRDQWAVMPRMDLEAMDTDTMQLEFYALAGYYNPNTGKISASYMSGSNLPSIVVGVMSDPADLSTFTPLDTCTYDLIQLNTSVEATPENGCMFQRFIVPLAGIKGKGEYLVFKTYLVDYLATQPTASSMTTQLYIDDVSVVRYKECAIPDGMEVSEVSATSVTLSWNGDEGASWLVNLSADPNFADSEKAVLAGEVATDMSLVVTGLDTAKTYYWTVQQVCDEQSISDISQPASFKTAYVPMFREEFMDKTIPMDWLRDTTRACYVFEGAPLSNGLTTTWARVTNNYGIYGSHMAAPMNSSSTATDTVTLVKKAWFATPVIQLDAEREAWFTFSLALTYYNSDKEADKNGWDDQFMVIISEDGGKTWKRENALIWNNEKSNDPTDVNYVYGKGDYVLSELPTVGEVDKPMTISLAKYKGKNVRVAFYSESTVRNAYNQIHIGKVHLNYVEYMEEDEVTSCQYEDVVSEMSGIYISGDDVTAGSYEYKKIDFASLDDLRENPNDGLVDTLYTFKATILEAPERVIEKTICEGESAGSEWEFQDRTTSGVYRRKGTSLVTGCDSITTLRLTVIPRQYSEEIVTICKGTSYEFNGKFYSETCVQTDTLSSVLTGCDSITTLILTVNPPLTYEYTYYACSGYEYYFTANYPALTLSGKYVDTLRTAEGCDSIVTLNLVVADKIERQISDTLCEGEVYEVDGKALTESGSYEFTYTSVGGCDSTVIYNLVWNKIDTVVVDTTISASELPYMYPNTDITYPKGTSAGVYVDTVQLPLEGNDCGYVLIHKLTVTVESAVDNILSGVTIQPSLIEPGEAVVINAAVGNGNTTVKVYDMVGRCVAQQPMTDSRMELDVFNTAGVYMVQVSNEDGFQYIGRVIVK